VIGDKINIPYSRKREGIRNKTWRFGNRRENWTDGWEEDKEIC
jgi:hypothetical protein